MQMNILSQIKKIFHESSLYFFLLLYPHLDIFPPSTATRSHHMQKSTLKKDGERIRVSFWNNLLAQFAVH